MKHIPLQRYIADKLYFDARSVEYKIEYVETNTQLIHQYGFTDTVVGKKKSGGLSRTMIDRMNGRINCFMKQLKTTDWDDELFEILIESNITNSKISRIMEKPYPEVVMRLIKRHPLYAKSTKCCSVDELYNYADTEAYFLISEDPLGYIIEKLGAWYIDEKCTRYPIDSFDYETEAEQYRNKILDNVFGRLINCLGPLVSEDIKKYDDQIRLSSCPREVAKEIGKPHIPVAIRKMILEYPFTGTPATIRQLSLVVADNDCHANVIHEYLKYDLQHQLTFKSYSIDDALKKLYVKN